ncbi:hypothetical protein HanRHA438_Chr09g0409851 [Helianthus annuus]|nr:hypothetical protein HanRHA438_Chr09g0409851 [Helianthus annuus]
MVVCTGSSGESEHRRQPNPHSRFFSDQPNTPPFDFRRQVQKRERERPTDQGGPTSTRR